MSDLNYLLYRQQRELLFAQAATCIEARLAHQGLARAFGLRIDDYRKDANSAPL